MLDFRLQPRADLRFTQPADHEWQTAAKATP
jgi:hypothetical protein